MEQFDFGGPIVWQPSAELVANSHLSHFMTEHQIGSFDELLRRSTDDIEWFWNAVLMQLDVRFHRPYEQVVDLSRGIEWPKWCVGGGLNIVGSMLDKYAGTSSDAKPAVTYESEDGRVESMRYAQLRRRVASVAAGLKRLGIGKGDVVGVFMPMTPECVIAMLAIIRIGGVFLPLFSGYGAGAIASRLNDAQAKALFTCDGFPRRGNLVRMKDTADAASRLAASVKHLIVHRRAGAETASTPIDVEWADLERGEEAELELTGAEDVLMLIYTSGTTGKPKGAVHTHCGFPIKAAQDMLHGFDLHADETMFWITDIGWMMGPWLIFGTLLLGATMFIYDGALDYPGPSRLWEMVERHRVTALGISPTLVRSLIRFGDEPVKKHDLSSLRKFGSTGEPWNPEPWRWLIEVVGGGRLPMINYSGGTEISGGIICGNVLSPMKPCAFSAPLPGMAADVVDDNGNPVRGQVGELIIRKPWIGMTRGFWRDPERYLNTYWSRFAGVWTHGDFAAVDEDGLWYILGRSDDTLKIAGKRLGPAEVESILVAHPAVSEAAAIGVPDEVKGQALVCYCVLKPGKAGDESLRRELVQCIVREMGKPLAPKALLFVGDLPKTRNAKVMRRVIRSAYLGQDAGDISSLENPAAVEACAKAARG